MKNIFTKTFMLFTLLSLSAGVWGGQYDLNFLFTKIGASTKEDVQAYTNCSSYEDKDKAIMDSDWEWNTGKGDLENNGYFVSLKNSPKACSHIEYEFPAGNVTVKLYAHFISNDAIATFPVRIGTYTCNFAALSQDDSRSNKDYMYEGTINVGSAGTYRITVDFPSGDKMQVSHMTFDYAGGPTPPPTNFTAGQTIFFRSNGEGAWKDNACVITEYSNNWNNKQTADLYWMYNVGNTDYKMFYGIVPSGTYDRVQLHRYAANKCYSTTQGDYWNDAGWVSVDGSKNTFYSKGAGGSDGEWYSTNYEMYLKGSINWTPNLATFTDQLNGDFAASYNNFQPSATSYEFRVFDNNGQGFGSGNTTLSGLNTNSTYNITASFNIGSRGTLNLAKTFVKGKVTFNANGRGTAPSALDNVLAGAKIAEPEMAEVDHYYVEGWYKESGCTSKWNFATDEVTESMTLYAKWVAVPQYTITASADPSDKGSVTGGGTYYRGETVTLTAEPTTGNEFVEWSDHNTENPRVFTASTNLTLTATFQKVCDQLTIQCEDSYLPLGVVTGGKSSPSSGKFTCYKDGQSGGHSYSSSSHGNGYICIKDDTDKEIYFVFDAPEAGTYKFNVWAGVDQNMWLNVYTTNGDGDAVTYNAQTYKKKGNMKLNGSGSDKKIAAMGDLAVSLPKGRCIIGLYNGWGYPAYDQIVITASSDVFCFETYALTLSSGGNGSAESDQADNTAIPENTEVTITATPNTGYKFVNWTGFSTETNNPFTFTMTGNMSYQANFAVAQQFTITASSTDPSKGSVTGGGTYYEGETVTLTATPTTGNEFVEWSDHNTENPRIFTASENLTLTATFKKSTKVCTNTLTWEAEDESKIISPTGVETCEYIKDKHCNGEDASSMVSSASDGHFISMKQNANADSKCIYYHFSTSETANLAFTIRAGGYYNNKSATIILYSTKQSGSQIFTYDDKSYKKVSEQVKALGGSDKTWSDVECTFTNQPADDYVVAVHSSENYWTIYFDKFTITASDDVFCTEAPAVTTWSVYGNFDGDWKDYEMTDGVVTISNLGRASNYQFKLRKTSDEGENYTYYGAQNQENNMTSSNCTNWTLTNTNNGYDIKITTGATGSYTFTATDLTGDSPKLSVTYPTAYTITFNDNYADGGTAMTNITNIASGGSETLPTMTRTKTGYRFTGWKDASSNDYADGATIENITSDITLTAQWETVVTVVTVTAEGGVDEIMVGNTLQMSVAYTPSDAAYGRSVTWSSSNTNLATISNEGLVSALQPGSVTITATSLNGVQGNYNLTIVASACGEGVWKMTYWPQGSGNKSEYCFTQIGETHEWRRDYTLPSVADWFSIGQVGGANDHSKDWTFNALTTIGLQSNKDATKYYPGQDAVGYLRIFDDSENDNYYVAFEPIYQALFGIENGSDPWTVLDFEKVANTDHEYETSTFQVPEGYKTNDNYKYYVGTKRANQTSQFVSGKSNSDKLNTVSGLKDSDMSGKYGKFHIWDNSADNNWYCEFKRYYRLSYSGEGTEGYNPHDVYSDGSSSARTVTLGNVPVRTGYNISGWTIGGVLHPQGSSYEITDDATAIATWTPIVYHITYNDVEGATNTNPATYTIENTPIALQNPEKTGYDFVKWTIEEEDITTIAAGTTGDLTLTAHWTPTVYYITYEGLDGAENTNPTTYTIESETINFVDPGNRTGYTFNSWDIASIAHGSTGNKTITASWNLVNYSITYHDATTTNPTSYTIESSFDLTDPSPRTGFTFLGWYTDAQFTNQITAITAGMHENKDIYAKWESEYCSNTFTIQCEDDIIRSGLNVGSEGSTPNGMKVIPDDEGPYDKYPNYTGRGYIDLKGNTGATYYAVHLPAATYSFDIYKTNGGNKKLRLYSKSYGSDGNNISYNGTTYKRIFSDQYSTGDSEGSFTSATVSNKTLQEDDYIVALYSEGWASYDKIVITANSKVFCPEMYTVTFPQPEHGTVTAAIKDGAAISSGDEVPENTVVVFTASDIAEGYELVNWTDGESHELAGAVNSFEQKITSNITVNANIEEEATKYTVTATAGDDHGSITSGAGEYREGATVTIVTAPATNYKVGSAMASNVNEFTIDGNNVSFTMPAAAVDVTINFAFDEVHALIITPNSNETYTFGNKEGYATTFNISSATDPTGTFDHNVLKLEYDGMSGQYAGRSISKDAGYTPNAKATGFAFWYRTEKSDDGIAFCFQKTDNNQTKWQMQATNGEWRYYYWEDNDASNYATNANFKIYMNGSDGGATTKYNSGTYYITEIQATNVTEMSPIVPPVDLTVVVSPNESGTVTTSPATTTGLTKGAQVTLTATPADNYRFVNWTVGGIEVSTDATYTHTVNATETITANFVRVYTLVVNKDEHITEVTGAGQYEAGAEVTITATAAQGYKFTNWTEGTAGGTELAITSSYTFSMPATDNYTIYANSEEDIVTYQITLGSCINGTIAATVNDEPYTGTDLTANTPVVLTATPAEGYGFVQWKDGSRENPHTIYANAETEGYNPWTATFAQQFTVTATYGQPGTSVTGGGEYPNGADVTLTANWTLASKDFTYGFKEWIDVTGVNLSDEQKVSNPLSFSMPFANVSMKATFAPVECVDTFVIQCEDDQAYIPWNKQDEDLTKYPNSIPHDGECGPRHDYYKGYHGAGYYDYKKARAAEMYYPIELPASTYKFEIWSASNGYKNCWMNLYIESDDPNPEVVYKGVNYKKTSSVTANNDCGAGGNFAMSGTIDNVVLSSPKSVIIGLYCGEDYGSFDQIKITADDAVFCEEKSIETFTIAANEAKEIPVSGVKNLVIYEGGQATNDDDVEVFETVKYIRSITEANIDQWSTLAVPYTATKTQVSKGGDVDDIYPVWRMENGNEQAGYYFMEVLTNNNPEAIGVESRARWDMSYTQQPQKDSAYITMFPRDQSDGYFIGSEIFYIGDYKSSGGVTLTGSKNAFIENGGWPEEGKPKYYYFPNSAITAIQPYDAYVLSEDGTEFVITDHPTIKPFQCYIQATTKFKELYPRLVIRQNSGGTTDLIPVTADGWNVSGVDKVMIDEVIYVVREGKIYTVMGQLVK